MRSSCLRKPTRMIAGLLAGLLLAIPAVPLGAQSAPKSRAARGFGPAYDAAHEITLQGTIQEVVTRRVIGSPAGVHLLVAGPQGVVDAHLGPFLSGKTITELQSGMPVEIVGATVSLNGREYLLARELVVDGHSITIRNARGIPVLQYDPHSRRTTKATNTTKTAKVDANGGTR